jgi:hypothetical protein
LREERGEGGREEREREREGGREGGKRSDGTMGRALGCDAQRWR